MPPIPTKIFVSQSSGNLTRVGRAGILRTLLKNWYIILVLVALIPNIITSIHVAKETHNPSYPFIKTAFTIVTADSVIYEDSEMLKTNSSKAKLIGMEKPTAGIWNKTKYKWKVFLIIWKFLGNIFLITFPFSIIYRLMKWRDQDKLYKNIIASAIWGFIFTLVCNLYIIIYRLSQGSLIYKFPVGVDQFQSIWYIILATFPFHGIVNLVTYIVGTL